MQKKHLLIVSLSSLNNDSRIRKTIASLSNLYNVTALSNGTTCDIQCLNIEIGHLNKRYKNIPGTNKLFHWYKILKAIKTIDFSLYNFIHCNDIGTLPIGFLAKKLNKKIKIIYDAHEYETEKNNLHGFQKIFLKLLEKLLIKHADAVITVSDAIADEYVRLYGIKKPALVLNTPPFQEIEKKNIFRETFGIRSDQTIFLYQGGLSKGRGIEVLLEAFETLSSPEHVIVFMGYGPLQQLIEEKAAQCASIFFHPAVSPDVLLDYTSSADVGISMIENVCLSYYYCLPNKMFEYLMAEIPVIVSNLYEMKMIVKNNHIGVVAEENSVLGLQKAIMDITQMDRSELRNNIQRIKHLYNWEQQENVLLQLYAELSESK